MYHLFTYDPNTKEYKHCYTYNAPIGGFKHIFDNLNYDWIGW